MGIWELLRLQPCRRPSTIFGDLSTPTRSISIFASASLVHIDATELSEILVHATAQPHTPHPMVVLYHSPEPTTREAMFASPNDSPYLGQPQFHVRPEAPPVGSPKRPADPRHRPPLLASSFDMGYQRDQVASNWISVSG